MAGRFDSNTEALKERERINVAGALHDLDEWIIKEVCPFRGMRVLDLGCGTGKQIFCLAEPVGPSGSILGTDISEDAVREVNATAQRMGFIHVQALMCSIDECPDRLRDSQFDLILSTYAIYYASDMIRVLRALRSLLCPQGQVFVCGPGRGTNQEIIALANRLLPDATRRLNPVEDFISETELADVGRSYSGASAVRLFNTIRFDSPTALLRWWRNHNSFAPELEGPVSAAVHAHFNERGNFVLTKNVLGVHFFA